jgi:quercetin dioxygenase-like cupin family protein
MSASRALQASARPFTRSGEAETTVITAVEGRPLPGPVRLRILAVTPNMVLVETTFAPGAGSPPHQHADHDSIVYVVRGRMRVTIGGDTWEAGPGDAFLHLPGVVHHMEALEETVTVEVKSPPIRTWQAGRTGGR